MGAEKVLVRAAGIGHIIAWGEAKAVAGCAPIIISAISGTALFVC
jgi:hypothetical protein